MLEVAIDITFYLLLVALGLSCIRLALGPTLPDRVVALDLITVLAMAVCALFAIAGDHPAYVDVAIALALVAFLATVAFARYIERLTKAGGPPGAGSIQQPRRADVATSAATPARHAPPSKID